jgi:hypothetical protein
MDKPEALFLADELEAPLGTVIGAELYRRAAAELRRLSAENKLLHERHHDDNVEYTRVLAQRDALLEMLKLARSIIGHPDDAHSQMIDAAIKAVEGGEMSKPCEYCGVDLPLGVDKRTRRVRSFHFASCEKRPQTTPPSLDIEAQRDALLEALKEINSWLVCACIATPEDMAQSFPHMEQVAYAAIKAVEEGK